MIKLGRICLTLLQVHVVSNSGHHMCVLCARAPVRFSVAVTIAAKRYLENSGEFNSAVQQIMTAQPVPM